MLSHGEDTPQGTLCALPICPWNPLVAEASLLSQPQYWSGSQAIQSVRLKGLSL